MRDDSAPDWTELLVIVMLVLLLSMPFAADAARATSLSPPPASSDWRA